MSSSALSGPRVLPATPSAAPAVSDGAPDVVDVWGIDSFPASDPPANW